MLSVFYFNFVFHFLSSSTLLQGMSCLVQYSSNYTFGVGYFMFTPSHFSFCVLGLLFRFWRNPVAFFYEASPTVAISASVPNSYTKPVIIEAYTI